MKKILIALILVVLVFVGGIAFILSNLDEYVKEAIETVGSDVTQVSVTLGEADIDPANGKASLSSLVVGNPAGFETDYAMSLGGISIVMDPTTVTGDVIVIKEISIDSPAVIYELGGDGSNIDTIQKNVESYVNSLTGGTSEQPSNEAESDAKAGEEQKFIIEHVYIRNTQASLSAKILSGKTMGITVPDIHLTDIGKEEGGETASEAATQILDSWMTDISAAAGKIDLGGIGDVAKDLVKESGALGEAGGEAIGDAVKDATGALNNLFGSDSN